MKKVLEAFKAALIAARPGGLLALKAFIVSFLATLGVGFGFNVSPDFIESIFKLF